MLPRLHSGQDIVTLGVPEFRPLRQQAQTFPLLSGIARLDPEAIVLDALYKVSLEVFPQPQIQPIEKFALYLEGEFQALIEHRQRLDQGILTQIRRLQLAATSLDLLQCFKKIILLAALAGLIVGRTGSKHDHEQTIKQSPLKSRFH